MALIGLTGGIGSGKSTVSKMLIDLGIDVIDSDSIAHKKLDINEPAYNKIVKVWGKGILDPDSKAINRKKLGELIFNDESSRRKLNSIVHPEIYKTIFYEVFYKFLSNKPLIVIDLPLLYESGYMIPYLSHTIVVFCDKETQIERVMNRNLLSRKEAESRVNAQWPMEKKTEKAEFVINNEGDLKETEKQVHEVVKSILKKKKHLKMRFLFWSLTLTICTFTGLSIWKIFTFFY